MCGRFNLTKPQDIEARFGFLDWHERRIEPRFNIAPTQEILTIVQPPSGARGVQVATWGLVPFWARKSPSSARRPQINARAETANQSPMFRTALAGSRCLIPATGFFEWRAEPGTKVRTPMHIQLASGEVFAFAGLWLPGPRDGLPSATIVTTRPNELMSGIHNRMPVILQAQDEALWLDPSVTDPERVLPLLQPFPAELMRAHEVSPLVNSFVNDGPDVLQPVLASQPRLC